MEDGYMLVDRYVYDNITSYYLRHQNNNRICIDFDNAEKKANVYINGKYNTSYYIE